MPGLYGFSSNANISVYNTTGLYNLSNGNIILGNVSGSNSTGLYATQGNVYVPTNAQQLLNLLSNNGTVLFQLDPAYANQKVEAFATGGGGGGNITINLVGDVTGFGVSGNPVYTTLSNTALTHYTGNITGSNIILTGNISSNNMIVTTGIFYANGQPFVSSSYGNANVAAYLPTYQGNLGTIRTGNVNTGNIYAGNMNLTGNLRVTGNIIYSNVQFINTIVTTDILANATTPSTNTTTGAIVTYGGVGIVGDVNIGGNINANLGALAVGGNITSNSNAIVQGIYTDNYFYANGQPFQSSVYSNVNVAAYIPTDPTIQSIQANLGAFETYSNVTFVTNTALQTLDANVGAFEIYSNANAATQATSINTINANLGAYQTYANTQIQTVNANLGAYQIYANANAASQATSINTINANLGAYQIYANANAASQATSINTINANLGAFETYANTVGSLNTLLPYYIGNIGRLAGDAYTPVSWGFQAGQSNRPYTIAIGPQAGSTQQQTGGIAIGQYAGQTNQAWITPAGFAIAIGVQAGQSSQGGYSTALGYNAGATSQGPYSLAIGYNAGATSQGNNAIAIGGNAASTSQVSNSIVFNASPTYSALNPLNQGLYIDPVRNDSGNTSQAVYYNTTTKELTYSNLSSIYGNTQVAAYLTSYGGNIGGGPNASIIVSQTFTSNSSWVAPPNVTEVTAIIVGGGGGGAFATSAPTGWAGGGGAGGNVIVATTPVLPGQSYNIVVGAGGSAGLPGKSSSFGNLSVTGGNNGASAPGGTGAGGTTGIPNGGGGSGTQSPTAPGNGGGGSSTASNGGNGSTTTLSGAGGAGVVTPAGTFGGGGGGGRGLSTPGLTGGTGGSGGGGNGGGPSTSGIGVAGTPGTGGGGGGGALFTPGAPTAGGAGAPGVVVVTYAQPTNPYKIISNTFTVIEGITWANGTNYSSTLVGNYGNSNVAAYLPTDPTFTGYLTFANANAATQATSINTINANLGAYQTYANANAATQATSINTINANLGAYQTYANTSINTINANLGAYETWANATINSIDANIGILYLGNLSTQANLGAFQTYANLHFADQTYSNANVAAYLPIYGGNILLGNITNDGHHWQFNADGSETYPSATAVTTAAGKMWYNSTNGSWNLGMGGGNVTQQVGEELFVYGKASSAIADSPLQIVYKTGTVGASGVITFAPTVAGITNDDVIVGVATESIALNATGRVTSFGVVHGITTNGTAYGETWADGDVIWYNPVTGNPTKTKPVAPYVKCQIGTVINAGSGGSGSFQVEIIHGTNLGGTDQNAQITSPTAAQILTYDATSQYWKNTNLNAGTNINVTTASDGNITVNNTYGNTQVAAYLPTDPTITSIQANIGGSETYANVTFATKTALQTLDANVGAFETYANATFGGSSYGNSNVAAYLPTDPTITGIQANVGAFETYSNVTFATKTALQTLDANVGLYETTTNANLGTATTNITTLFSNAASQATAIDTINANLGAFETYANATFGTSSYGNANVAAYLPVYSGNVGLGGGNINLNSVSRIGPVWGSSPNTLAFTTTQTSDGLALIFEGNSGGVLIDQMVYLNKDNLSLRTNNANYIWTFDKSGNLTLPGTTSSINYSNGVSILSGIGGGGSSYGNVEMQANLKTYTGTTIANLVITSTSNADHVTATAGALQVRNGGASIGKDLYVAGNTYVGTTAGPASTSGVYSATGYFWANGTAYSTGGGGGSQTPWTSNIAGGGYYLTNAIFGTVREKVIALGNQTGTLTFDLNNGSFQSLTATGNITINTTAFTNIASGQSITVAITQDATGSRYLTSNLKYAGNVKTLSTAPSSTDMISVFYDGTNYWASLNKGFV